MVWGTAWGLRVSAVAASTTSTWGAEVDLPHLADSERRVLGHNQTFGRWIRQNYLYKNNLPSLMVLAADKLRVKPWIMSFRHLGLHVPQTYFNESNASVLSLKDLPASYVLKPNHASGCTLVVRDGKLVLERKQVLSKPFFLTTKYARKVAAKWLRTPFGLSTGELWYLEIPRAVFAEEYLKPKQGDVPIDYKFHVVHHRVIMIQLDILRGTMQQTRQRYSPQWRHLNISGAVPDSSPNLPRPKQLPKLLWVAEEISRILRVPFVRVDLYVLGDVVYFSEATFAPSAGTGNAHRRPKFVDNMIGYMLKYPDGIDATVDLMSRLLPWRFSPPMAGSD